MILLAACSEPTPATPPASHDRQPLQEIRCDAAYRSRNTRPIEQERSLALPTTSERVQVTKRARFGRLTLVVSYSDDGVESPALTVRAMSVRPRRLLTSDLYQFDRFGDGQSVARPLDEFVGGNSFTGLGYAFDPTSRAELEYWCTAS